MSKILRAIEQAKREKEEALGQISADSRYAPEENNKSSFVKFLIDQKRSETFYEQFKKNLQNTTREMEELLRDRLKKTDAMLQMFSDETLMRSEKNQTEIKGIKKRIKKLEEFIRGEFESFRSENQKVLSGVDSKPALESDTAEYQKKIWIRYYENENIKLKQINMNLIRGYYRNRYQGSGSAAETDSPSENRAKFEKNELLIQEIKKLEAKKSELIKDNVQINRFSEEILKENEFLKEELKKYTSQESREG